MIIEAILERFYFFLDSMLSIFEVPDMPAKVVAVLEEVIDMIITGISLLNIFIDMRVALPLLGVVMAFITFEWFYRVVMFILRKFPFLGVD